MKLVDFALITSLIWLGIALICLLVNHIQNWLDKHKRKHKHK